MVHRALKASLKMFLPPPFISSLLRSELQEVREAAVARSAAREHVSMRQITHALFV